MLNLLRRTAQSSACRFWGRALHSYSRPRRAMLYMPGSSQKMLAKGPTLDVDAVCMDLEDGVAPSALPEARANIREALETFDFGRSERLVRVNSRVSKESEYFTEDVKSILQSSVMPDGFVLPKVEAAEDLHALDDLIGDDPSRAHINVIAIVETARGILNLPEIVACGRPELRPQGYLAQDPTGPCQRLVGVIFGADDYAASVGAIRTVGNREVMLARQSCILHAKPAGLQALDLVNIRFHDEEALRAECLQGYEFGFTGKQIIHPNQIKPTQETYSPSAEKLQWAVRVVNGFAEHAEAGTGAFSLDIGGGQKEMIDMPTVRLAQQLVDFADSAGLEIPEE